MSTVRVQPLFVFFVLLTMDQLLMGAEEGQSNAVAPYVLKAGAGTVFLKRYDKPRIAQKVDFRSLRGILFTFASGAGAWRTEVAMQPDGTFNGQYSDSNMGEDGPGYPNGTVYICNFSGVFSSPEKADEAGYAYNLKCVELSREGTPDEEKIIDGVRYVNARPYGFENAVGERGCTLFLPGTPFDKLPESFLQDKGIELEGGETPMLDEYVLYIPSDGSEDSYDVFFYGALGDDSGCRLYDIDWKPQDE